MPCNLTARADAKVSNAALAKLLTPQVVKTALTAFFAQRKERADLYDGRNSVTAYVGNFTIQIANGEVSVNGIEQARCTELANAVKAYLSQIAGLLFQQSVQETIKRKFAVESMVTAPSGAKVITVEF
ncbi:MAG: hypothetical protein HZB51_34305 [Chloroflexi bacterium]|nr:hypothetical protein [Chloroflexota bacterium]